MGWRFVLLLAMGGCQFQHGIGSADGGGVLETDALNLPPGQHWLFETAADFGAAGFDSHAMTIDPSGALTLDGYLYGGLLMYGKQDVQLWSTTSTTYDWATTGTLTPDGIGLWNTDYTDTNSNLANAGVTSTTKFTIWIEGEIYCDVGDLISLNADGAGFVDMRLPAGWTRMVLGKSDGTHTTTTPIATAGWYPVRVAWGEGTGAGVLDFRRGPSGTAVHFDRHRLRSAASKLRGTLRQVFYRQIFGGGAADATPPVSSVDPSGLMPPQAFATTVLGASSTDDWSARWYGQFYAPTAGVYALQTNSDDGDELMLEGVSMTSHWGRDDCASASTSTVSANLTVGWHDVVLDYNQCTGMRALSATITMAPDPALVGSPIPLAMLRPVEPRGDRLISATEKFTSIDVPNNTVAGVSIALPIDGFSSEKVTSIDVTAKVVTQHLDQLVFSLQRPAGAKTTIATHPTGGAFNGYFQVTTAAANVTDQAPTGMWTFNVADDTGGGNVTGLTEVALTVHTSGGPEKIALSGDWISPVHDAGKAPVHVIDVVWSERAAMPTQMFVRSCAMADCSDDPPWGNALGQHGTAEAATRYLQLKAVMTSDGTTEPELDALALTYRTD